MIEKIITIEIINKGEEFDTMTRKQSEWTGVDLTSNRESDADGNVIWDYMVIVSVKDRAMRARFKTRDEAIAARDRFIQEIWG